MFSQVGAAAREGWIWTDETKCGLAAVYRDAAPRSKLRGAAFSARRTKNINYLQHNLERLLLMAQRPVFLRTAIRLGWGTAQLIESDHAGNARDADVGVDGSGNVAAVLFRYDGTRNNIASNVVQ